MKAGAMPKQGSAGTLSIMLPPKSAPRHGSLNGQTRRDSDEDDGEDGEGGGAAAGSPSRVMLGRPAGSPSRTRGRPVSPERERPSSPMTRQAPAAEESDMLGMGSFGSLPSRTKPAAGERRYIRTGLDDAAAALAATSRLRMSVSRIKASAMAPRAGGGGDGAGGAAGLSLLLPPKIGAAARAVSRRLSAPDFAQMPNAGGLTGRRLSDPTGTWAQDGDE